jgi:small-conductance mechanosensitive channel
MRVEVNPLVRSKTLISLLLALAALVALSSACVSASDTSPAATSSQPELVPAKPEGDLDELPTRTPEPTPTAGPVDQAVSELLGTTEFTDQVFFGLTVEEWVSILVSLALFLIIYIIGLWLVRTPLRWLVRRTPTDFDDEFFTSVQTPLKILVAFFGLDFALQRLNFLGEGIRQFLGDVFFILYLLTGLYLAWQLVLFTEDWYRDQLTKEVGEEQYDTVASLIRRMILVTMLILAFALLLDHFGFDISAITIIAVLIFLIYIAARDVLSDAINGFIILFDQPFRVGDRIKTPSMDTWGDVVDIGTRTTRIQTYDNRLVVIPNSDIANQQLDNYTYPDPTYRMQLDIGIQYGSDIRQVQEIIAEALAEIPQVLKDKPVEVLLIEFGESGLIFRVRWWVVTQTDFYAMSNLVNLAMIDTLGKVGIEISFTTYNIINYQPKREEVGSLSKPATMEDHNE